MKVKALRHLAPVVLGNLLLAAAVMLFISPHGIILGGSTGIGLIVTHFISVRLSVVVLIANLIFFVVGYLCLGKKFALTTLASTLLYPAMMAILEQLPITASAITENTMLAAVFGGVLMGAGAGLILRQGGSSGGTDTLSLILNKYLHMNVSAAIYLVDGIVLILQMLFSNPEQILYGLLVLALLSLTSNRIMLLGKAQVQLLIFTEQVDLIREKLLSEEDAGVTLFMIEKGYTEKEGQCVMCVVPRRKLWSINEMVSEMDPEAFVTVTEVKEVRGRGFSYGRH